MSDFYEIFVKLFIDFPYLIKIKFNTNYFPQLSCSPSVYIDII